MPMFFTDGSDLEGVLRTRDVPYVKRLGRVLALFGAWPAAAEALGAEHPSKQGTRSGLALRVFFVLLCAGAVLPSNIASLFLHPDRNVLKLGHIVITILLNSVGLSKVIFFFYGNYWKLIDKFLDDIHLFNHRHRNEHFHKMHLLVHTRCHTLWGALSVVLSSGVFLYNARPLYVNVSSGVYSGADRDYEYSIYLAVPHYDLQRQFWPHVVCSAWNIFVSGWCVSTIWLPDLFAMKVVLHIWGHMRVLITEMASFTEEMEETVNELNQFDEQQSVAARKTLKYFVDCHRHILSYVKATNETFSGVYFVYFIYFQVSLCIMMWECSQGIEGIIQYGVLTASSVFSLSLLCIVMELITTENDSLERAVYCLPWQLMRVPERRTMLLMLMRVQRPLRMKALGLTEIGVGTMAATLKASMSYFMLLRSIE